MATFEEYFAAALACTTQADADAAFEILVRDTVGEVREAREQLVRENLAYHAGYHGNEVRERVERLYKCKHPILGAIAEFGPPDPDEAFRLGAYWAVNESKADGFDPAQFGKFVVRLWDGMDGCWTDVSEPVSRAEALAVWWKHTHKGRKKIRFADIDYYRIFNEGTAMLWDGREGREMHR